MTNAVEISDEVSQDDPIYPTTFKKKEALWRRKSRKKYIVSEAFLFVLCKITEKAVSVLWYAKSERVCIHRNYMGCLQS